MSKITATDVVILKRERRIRRLRVPRFFRVVRPRNFVWLAMLLIVVGIGALQGTPHFLWEYDYFGTPDRKVTCTYIGKHSQAVPAVQGRCPIIALLRSPY